MHAKIPRKAENVTDKTPKTTPPSRADAEEAVRTLIAWAGDDPSRPGLVDTPKRVVDAFGELYSGYGRTADDLLERTFDDLGAYDDLVLVRDIPVYSQCEHHMMPFFGRAHIGYFPNGRVAGLSKLARLVDLYARRLQSQERLTSQVRDALENALQPRGLAVVVDSEHTCMTTRGIKAHGATTLTTQFTGVFLDDPAAQARFLNLTSAGAHG